jgi:hypothetical protein
MPLSPKTRCAPKRPLSLLAPNSPTSTETECSNSTTSPVSGVLPHSHVDHDNNGPSSAVVRVKRKSFTVLLQSITTCSWNWDDLGFPGLHITIDDLRIFVL